MLLFILARVLPLVKSMLPIANAPHTEIYPLLTQFFH
jgi:hypothetical protein